MNPVTVFLVGMVGASAPEIVRLHAIRNHPSRFRWSWFYLVVSVAFAALGGALAVILPATTYAGALFIGASTPVLVNSMAKKGRELNKGEQLKGPGTPRPRLSPVDSYVRAL